VIRSIALLAGLSLCSCSPVLEATRPAPVDLARFTPGEPRTAIMDTLGTPQGGSAAQGDRSCDYYRLHTSGPGDAGKGAIAAGEVVADVFTLGLAEVVLTPVEAATRDKRHVVAFCYATDQTLVSVRASDVATD
jgi:hypothetical protein